MVGLVVGASARPAIYRAGGNVTIDANTVLGSGVSSAAKHATLGVYNGGSSFVGVDNWLTGGVSGAAGAANGIAIAVFALTVGAIVWSAGSTLGYDFHAYDGAAHRLRPKLLTEATTKATEPINAWVLAGGALLIAISLMLLLRTRSAKPQAADAAAQPALS